ncbi:MAG: cobyrinate a,c-diamide synthase [Desulfovibrio sp.]|uniref:cobyrinate a,c-diamide synthase n=1 Tax=Desulfovibrio sp. TaxID=885 RepID=UPI001A75AA53|nr:cobyrinate a,c-diamide synthase [Desulfovibrio sp.]MBD5417041.1 cobyrinate a,c-diamide synthase [Desulfovibrio sp.]
MDATPPKRAAPTRFPRLCVSAASGGGGKTLLCLGLARAFCEAGLSVKPFKKGPDYIDAAWLGRAAGGAEGTTATNLDPFFLDAPELVRLFARSMEGTGIAAAPAGAPRLGLIEGNRGLYDGLDTAGTCSTARLARILDCPLLLCLNAAKMTRTAVALLSGLIGFEPGLLFCGVVFNRVGSPRHEGALRRMVEVHLELPVLGALPRLEHDPLPERHMGIASTGEGLSAEADALLDELARLVRAHVDVDAVLAAAREAPPLPGVEEERGGETASQDAVVPPHISVSSLRAASPPESPKIRPRIGYVRDAAFWFYYPENLAALTAAGAELVPLALAEAPEHKECLWDTLDGLYLGGGFPEDYLPQLSGSPQLARVAALARAGLPVYAECGGLILLSRGMERDGAFWPLGGVLPLRAVWTPRPQGLGYVEGTVRAANPFFPVGLSLRGHEFHYSRCVREADAPAPALELSRGSGTGAAAAKGKKAGDGVVCGRTWGAYTHIFAPAVPCWAPSFVAAATAWRAGQR